MSVRIRFFARFRELLGTDIMVNVAENRGLLEVVSDVAQKNREGYDALFDKNGVFFDYVILMQNGKRVETSDAQKIMVSDGDEIAVFPPVAGG